MTSAHLIRLEWRVCLHGHEIRPFGDETGDWIIARGTHIHRDFRSYRVGLLENGTFLDLINSAKMPDATGVLEFVNRWGLFTPTNRMQLAQFVDKRRLMISLHERGYKHCARLLDEERKSWGQERVTPPPGLGMLQADYTVNRGNPAFFLTAHDLFQFCVLEWLQAQAGGVDLAVCGACQKLLPLHKEGRPKSYCDDRCKMRAHRKRQASRCS